MLESSMPVIVASKLVKILLTAGSLIISSLFWLSVLVIRPNRQPVPFVHSFVILLNLFGVSVSNCCAPRNGHLSRCAVNRRIVLHTSAWLNRLRLPATTTNGILRSSANRRRYDFGKPNRPDKQSSDINSSYIYITYVCTTNMSKRGLYLSGLERDLSALWASRG